MTLVVGTFHLQERTTFTQHYETAAWYQEHVVEPGDYDLVATWSGTWYFSAVLPSVKGRSNFQTLLAGVAVGQAYDATTGMGEPDTYRLSVARGEWELAARLLAESQAAFDSSRTQIVTVDPERIEFTVEAEVETRRIDLGVDPISKPRTSDGRPYLRLTAEVPTYRVRGRVTVRVPAPTRPNFQI